MEKLRIVIDPTKWPGMPVEQLKMMIEDAEIVLLTDIDPLGVQIGQVMLMKPCHDAPGLSVWAGGAANS